MNAFAHVRGDEAGAILLCISRPANAIYRVNLRSNITQSLPSFLEYCNISTLVCSALRTHTYPGAIRSDFANCRATATEVRSRVVIDSESVKLLMLCCLVVLSTQRNGLAA